MPSTRVAILIVGGVTVISLGLCMLSQEIRVESEEETYTPPDVATALHTSDLPPGLAPWVQRNPDEVVELPRLLQSPGQVQDGCGECKRLQVSVQRDVPDFPTGTWRHISEERGPGSWRIVIHSPEAVFIRTQLQVNLAAMPMRFFFYGATGVKRLERPFSSGDLDRTGGWGPIVEGEYLFIEVITGSSVSPPPLTIPQISHGYLPIPPFDWDPAGPCHNDVTCYPGWSDVSRGVARIYFQMGWGGWICTGSLLADADPTTQRLWFLTAQHCVSSDEDADTIIAYFDYRTDTCDDSMPSLGDANLAYGSDYVVGNATSDFTLLELDENPPGYQTFLGWSTGDLASGEDIVTVHHPSGSYQRITFGNEKYADFYWWPYDDNCWRVVYDSGSTEGGSSGAPLFDETGRYVRGQLWRGTASCWYMSGLDDFGRFGTSWDLGLSDYLLATTTPPEPETMTWDTAPHTGGPAAIEMKATTATDPSGVEYSFEETSGNPGSTNSGWQDSPEYADTGLQSGTQYCYRVKARATSPSLSETGWSSTECASTSIRGDVSGDGVVDLVDVLMLYRYVEGVLSLPPVAVAGADVDEDGDVDADDAQALANIVFGI